MLPNATSCALVPPNATSCALDDCPSTSWLEEFGGFLAELERGQHARAQVWKQMLLLAGGAGVQHALRPNSPPWAAGALVSAEASAATIHRYAKLWLLRHGPETPVRLLLVRTLHALELFQVRDQCALGARTTARGIPSGKPYPSIHAPVPLLSRSGHGASLAVGSARCSLASTGGSAPPASA